MMWLQIGCLGFGGPAGQIALMHEKLVCQERWICANRFQHALDYCVLLPGPEAQQLATYIGWLLHGTRGAIAAGMLFVLPGLCIVSALAWGYWHWGTAPMALAILAGVKPAVVALVVTAAWRMSRRALNQPWTWGLAGAALLASLTGSVPFPLVLVTAGLIGTACHSAPARPILDDADPPSANSQALWRCFIRTCFVFIVLWAGAVGALIWAVGPHDLLLRIAILMTQAALVTFGGAYAVLPYVVDAMVNQGGWISAGQAVDALAFGETTPGPLILVLSFMASIAAAQADIFGVGLWHGADRATLAGIAGALVAAYFTFLPSFFFILAGGPWVEASRKMPRVRGPLAGISAAVVGMIAALAIGFARPVLFPLSADVMQTNWVGLAIAGIALAALVRWRRGTIETILTAGFAGVLAQLIQSSA